MKGLERSVRNRSRATVGVDQAASWHRETNAGSIDTLRPHDRSEEPTVLLECPDGAEAQAIWRSLGRQGYHVTWCEGPPEGDALSCRAIRNGRCELVEHADVVLSRLDLNDPAGRMVVGTLNARRHDTPILVATTEQTEQRCSGILDSCTAIPLHMSARGLGEVVADALSDRV